jgi:hypothetical protein
MTMILNPLADSRLRLAGIGHINRFLADLERRYPGATGSAPKRNDTP